MQRCPPGVANAALSPARDSTGRHTGHGEIHCNESPQEKALWLLSQPHKLSETTGVSKAKIKKKI